MTTATYSLNNAQSAIYFSIPAELSDFPHQADTSRLLTMEEEQAFGFNMLNLTLQQMARLACDPLTVLQMLDEIDAAFTGSGKAEKAISLVLTEQGWIRGGMVESDVFAAYARDRIKQARMAAGGVEGFSTCQPNDLFYSSAVANLRNALISFIPYDAHVSNAMARFKAKCKAVGSPCKDLALYVSSFLGLDRQQSKAVCQDGWLSTKLGGQALFLASKTGKSIAVDKQAFQKGVAIHQEAIRHAAGTAGVSVAGIMECSTAFTATIHHMDRMAGTFARMNARLAEKIASGYRFAPDYEQVRSAAFQGLARAITLYAPERGLKFSTYATTWIKQLIIRDLIQQDLVRLPEGHHPMLMRVRAVYEDLPNASDEYVCSAAGVTKRDLAGLKPYLTGNGAVSLDGLVGDDGDEFSLYNLVADENNDFAGAVEEESTASRVDEILKAALTEREYLIVRGRLGLGGTEIVSVEELSSSLGTSTQNVYRLEKAALQKLAAIPELAELYTGEA